MRNKPDRVERTFHLLGWLMVFCYFSWWVRMFIPGATGAEFWAVTFGWCPLVGFGGFGWALLGLYRWMRDRKT